MKTSSKIENVILLLEEALVKLDQYHIVQDYSRAWTQRVRIKKTLKNLKHI